MVHHLSVSKTRQGRECRAEIDSSFKLDFRSLREGLTRKDL